MQAATPEAAQFYEDNITFFDLLLDIQDRLRTFHRENNNDLITSTGLAEYFFFIVQDELHVEVYKRDGYWDGDLFTLEEQQLIESTLLTRETSEGRFISANISMWRVEVSFLTNNYGTLYFGSPVMSAEQWMRTRWRVFTEEFNNDWSFYFYTTFHAILS